MSDDFDQARRDLSWLRGEDGVVSPREAVTVLARVLKPLLSSDGFILRGVEEVSAPGPDLIAERPSSTEQLGIEYKHHGGGRPMGVEAVEQLIRIGLTVPLTRLLLVGRFGFSSAARELAHRADPVSLELLDLAGIEKWIHRLETPPSTNQERIQLLIRSISHEFAQMVAEDPEVLGELEWRDLERMMERVMSGIGFDVILTPPSKDGGKDLILTCEVSSALQSFIVELKHWRAGKRVGKMAVSDFLQVVVTEGRSGGLFLSTSGYAADAFEGLTEVTRQQVRLGAKEKLVLLTQTYMRASCGLWSPPTNLPEVLFEGTL